MSTSPTLLRSMALLYLLLKTSLEALLLRTIVTLLLRSVEMDSVFIIHVSINAIHFIQPLWKRHGVYDWLFNSNKSRLRTVVSKVELIGCSYSLNFLLLFPVVCNGQRFLCLCAVHVHYRQTDGQTDRRKSDLNSAAFTT